MQRNEYLVIKELMCKLVEHVYAQPNTQEGIEKFNKWEKDFGELVITIDESLQRVTT